MERETRFEPATPTLARLCSTPELFPQKVSGARGRTRTDTRLPLPDFESGASTDFTTRANKELRFYLERYKKEIKKA